MAPEQTWEKVFFTFRFWPFETKMVKGTLSFTVKHYKKPLRLGTANMCHLCPGDFNLKAGCRDPGLGSCLGAERCSAPCAPGHCQGVFLD